MFLTREVHHRGVVFTVRYSCGVWHTVHPKVGIIITGGEDNRADLREGPVLCSQSRTDQNPAAQTGQKTSHLNIHQHRTLPHAACLMHAHKMIWWTETEMYGKRSEWSAEMFQANMEYNYMLVCVFGGRLCLYMLHEPIASRFCLILHTVELETGKTAYFHLSSFRFREVKPISDPDLSVTMIWVIISQAFGADRAACPR